MINDSYDRKYKQLKFFFRFLKELDLYQPYLNAIKQRADNLNGVNLFSKYTHSELLDKICNMYLYDTSALSYIDVLMHYLDNKEFWALKELWFSEIIDYKINHFYENNIFTDYEISKSKKYLNNIRRYERNCRQIT